MTETEQKTIAHPWEGLEIGKTYNAHGIRCPDKAIVTEWYGGIGLMRHGSQYVLSLESVSRDTVFTGPVEAEPYICYGDSLEAEVMVEQDVHHIVNLEDPFWYWVEIHEVDGLKEYREAYEMLNQVGKLPESWKERFELFKKFVDWEDFHDDLLKDCYEDSDRWQWHSEDVCEAIGEWLSDVAEAHGLPRDHKYWQAEGRNMGWRHRSGRALFEIEGCSGHVLLQKILPKTDCSGTVWKKGEGKEAYLYIRNAHHDAPTGEFYELWPHIENEEEENEE